MEQNKTGRYLKYAIGEIVLVVIGILIALQINNWNEQRKEHNKENQIVKSLYNEFLENFDYVEDRKQYLSLTVGESNKYLLMLCNHPNVDISPDSLITLLYKTFLSIPAYAPKVSTFKRIINNDDFNFIQQDSLKTLLSQYQPILDFTYFTNDLLQVFEQNFWTYSQNKFSGIALGKKSDLPLHKQLFDSVTLQKAPFKPDDVLSDISFQNNLTPHSLLLGYTLNRLTELQNHNKAIRNYIDKHYRF